MAYIDDIGLTSTEKVEIIKPVGRREITHAVHDIDGTHSLIRDWPPVMSIVIHYAMTSGLPEGFDSAENTRKLIEQCGKRKLEETDRFCVESAGLSALTQMEFGIRRAIELKNISNPEKLGLSNEVLGNNSLIIKRIWNGEERFPDVAEPEPLTRYLAETTPRLFKLYEAVLNGACRDRNTKAAWKDPEAWRVPGSMEFMKHLYSLGIVNFFVTGAVIYPEGGMYEEVCAVGFEVGMRKMVESVEGSSWDRKMPKDEVMRELFRQRNIRAENVLVVGDGRTEIKAGVEQGCVTVSLLPRDAKRQRELQIGFGTNYIFVDYTDPVIRKLIRE